MSAKEFVIPLVPAELEKDLDDRYIVREGIEINSSMNADDIHRILEDVESAVREPVNIYSAQSVAFDQMFRILQGWVDVADSVKQRVIDVLVMGMTSLQPSVSTLLANKAELDEALLEDMTINRNALKMYSYLLCWTATLCERDFVAAGSSAAGVGAKKGRGKKSNRSLSFDWDAQKERVIRVLTSTIELPDLARLWRLPYVEESFIKQFSTFSYVLLETSSNLSGHRRSLKEAVLHLLSATLNHYDNFAAVATSLINLMMKYEHLPGSIADFLNVDPAAQQPQRVLLDDMLKEVARIDDLSHESGGARALSQFITEVADRQPGAVLSNLSLLLGHLDSDVYALRSALVYSCGRILGTVLNTSNQSGMDAIAEAAGRFIQENEEGEETPAETKAEEKSADDEDKDGGEDTEGEQGEEEQDGGSPKQSPAKKRNASDDLQRTRESLFDILEARIHDMTSYTRSKCIQAWTSLCEQRAIPLNRLPVVMARIVGRLQDRGSFVRRSAVQFITACLQYNPYSPQLCIDSFQNNFRQCRALLEAKLEAMEMANAEATGTVSTDAEDGDDDGPRDLGHLIEANMANIDEETQRLIQMTKYYQDAVEFTERIEAALPKVSQLLGSKAASDVLEAINFIVTAMQFQLSTARDGVRRMMALVWSTEMPIRQAVLDAFQKLYLTAPSTTLDDRRQLLMIASQLMTLVHGASTTDLSCIDEGLRLMSIPPPLSTTDVDGDANDDRVQASRIPDGLMQTLWAVFGAAAAAKPLQLGIDMPADQQCQCAIILLSQLANTDPESVEASVARLIQCGLKSSDDIVAKYSCICLQRFGEWVDTQYPDRTRYAADHALFRPLIDLIVKDAAKWPTHRWCPVTEQAINAIYALCTEPESLCAEITRHMCAKLVGKRMHAETEDANDNTAENAAENDTESAPQKRISANVLTRVFFVVGHTALRQLTHLEHEHRQWKTTRDSQKRTNDAESTGGKKAKQDEEEEEMGYDAVAAQEMVVDEGMLRLLDTEVVNAANMLGAFVPILVRLVSEPGRHRMVQRSAILALTKFMCVSQSLCEQYLPTLFQVLRTSMDPVVRTNIVVSLADLWCRHPNTLEPWSAAVYARLRQDPDTRVRRHTLLILSHLILNDQVKVRAPIADMCRCLEDTDGALAQRARHFFHELSHKPNHPIYNVLPDIVSRLSSADETDVTDVQFQRIMGHLLQYIEKDRHIESLYERLTVRFKATRSLRQWRHLAFCLANLNTASDKTYRKFIDSFKCYASALGDNEVYGHIQAIAAKAKKSVNSETKQMVEDWEKQLEERHAKLAEQLACDKAATKYAGVKVKAENDADDSEDVDNDDEDGDTDVKAEESKTAAAESDEEEEEEEDNDENAPVRANVKKEPAAKKAPAKTTTRRSARSAAPAKTAKAATRRAPTRATRGRRAAVVAESESESASSSDSEAELFDDVSDDEE